MVRGRSMRRRFTEIRAYGFPDALVVVRVPRGVRCGIDQVADVLIAEAFDPCVL